MAAELGKPLFHRIARGDTVSPISHQPKEAIREPSLGEKAFKEITAKHIRITSDTNLDVAIKLLKAQGWQDDESTKSYIKEAIAYSQTAQRPTESATPHSESTESAGQRAYHELMQRNIKIVPQTNPDVTMRLLKAYGWQDTSQTRIYIQEAINYSISLTSETRPTEKASEIITVTTTSIQPDSDFTPTPSPIIETTASAAVSAVDVPTEPVEIVKSQEEILFEELKTALKPPDNSAPDRDKIDQLEEKISQTLGLSEDESIETVKQTYDEYIINVHSTLILDQFITNPNAYLYDEDKKQLHLALFKDTPAYDALQTYFSIPRPPHGSTSEEFNRYNTASFNAIKALDEVMGTNYQSLDRVSTDAGIAEINFERDLKELPLDVEKFTEKFKNKNRLAVKLKRLDSENAKKEREWIEKNAPLKGLVFTPGDGKNPPKIEFAPASSTAEPSPESPPAETRASTETQSTELSSEKIKFHLQTLKDVASRLRGRKLDDPQTLSNLRAKYKRGFPSNITLQDLDIFTAWSALRNLPNAERERIIQLWKSDEIGLNIALGKAKNLFGPFDKSLPDEPRDEKPISKVLDPSKLVKGNKLYLSSGEEVTYSETHDAYGPTVIGGKNPNPVWSELTTKPPSEWVIKNNLDVKEGDAVFTQEGLRIVIGRDVNRSFLYLGDVEKDAIEYVAVFAVAKLAPLATEQALSVSSPVAEAKPTVTRQTEAEIAAVYDKIARENLQREALYAELDKIILDPEGKEEVIISNVPGFSRALALQIALQQIKGVTEAKAIGYERGILGIQIQQALKRGGEFARQLEELTDRDGNWVLKIKEVGHGTWSLEFI